MPDVVGGIPVQCGGGMNLPMLLPLLGQQLENNISSVGWVGDRRCPATVLAVSSQGPQSALLFLTASQSSPLPFPGFIMEQDKSDPMPTCPFWKSVSVLYVFCCFPVRCWAGILRSTKLLDAVGIY